MIYGLYIFDRTGTDVFHRPYEKLKFDQEFLLQFLRAFTAFIQRVDPSERIECLNFENLKIIYSLSGDMVFTVCTDKNEDEMYVTDKLIKLQREFTLLRNASKAVEEMKEQEKTEETKEQEKILEESSEQEKTEIEAIDEQKKTEEVEDQVVEEVKEQGKVEESSSKVGEDIFEQFKVIADDILFPFFKMVILGQGGVGKTSLLKLIIGETPDSAYIPTIGVDVKEFDFEPKNTRLVFWDFSGQPRYRKLWQPFLEGADVAILVTDSKAESLPETRGILQMIRAEKPDTIIILIANKQDLPDALPPQEIEKQLGLPAHGFIATDPTYREKILQLLKKAISDLIEAKSLQTIYQANT